VGLADRLSLRGMLMAFALALCNWGCGGSSASTPPAISVFLSQTSATVQAAATMKFTATVTNDSAGRGVTWTIACSTALCGSVSPTATASGVATTYTAPTSTPASDLKVTLAATSMADPTKSIAAIIMVPATTHPSGTAKIVPNSLNFGLLYLSEKLTLATTLTNTANTTLRVVSITITGADASEFSQTNDCGTSVAGGNSCTISVTFAPIFDGKSLANISISDSSSDSPQQIPLSGSHFPSHLVQPAMRSAPPQNGTVATPQYILVKLGSPGGTVGRSNSVNDRGWVSGWSNLTGDANHHAVLWIEGQPSDLGVLGGQNSEIEFTATNNFGLLAGGSDTSNIDPYGENFCFFTASDNLLCSAFQWQNGLMTALPGLGGNNSYATGSNSAGHIVGWAETPTVDSKCLAPQVFDWHGALWKEGQVQGLPPLPGKAMSAAFAINDQDEAVGGSGICGSAGVQGFALSTNAVIWRSGVPTDLGNLGGQFNNIATAINNLGQVVGFSDVADDTTTHAFIWQDGVMSDLGTLPGDFFSLAWGIGDRGQVLGQSCDVNGNCRGFLWQDGVMTDVNTLIPAGSSLFIIDANDVSAAGEITGQAFDPLTGEMPAIEMIPCTIADDPGCRSKVQENLQVVLPQNVRDALLKRRLHFGK